MNDKNAKIENLTNTKFNQNLRSYTFEKNATYLLFETTPDGYRAAYNWFVKNPDVSPVYRFVIPHSLSCDDLADHLLAEKDSTHLTNELCKYDLEKTTFKIVRVKNEKINLDVDLIRTWPFPCENRPIDYFCAGYLSAPHIFLADLITGLTEIQEAIIEKRLDKDVIRAKYKISPEYLDEEENSIYSLAKRDVSIPNFLVNGPNPISREKMKTIVTMRLDFENEEEIRELLDNEWKDEERMFQQKGRIIVVKSAYEYFVHWFEAMLMYLSNELNTHLQKQSVIHEIFLGAEFTIEDENGEEDEDGKKAVTFKRKFLEENYKDKIKRLKATIHDEKVVKEIMDMKFSEIEYKVTTSGESVRSLWRKKCQKI